MRELIVVNLYRSFRDNKEIEYQSYIYIYLFFKKNTFL
jgi:hypothetical protein